MKPAKFITTTAVMIALLVILQSVTKAGGQLLTGSCVNLVLAVAVLTGGMACGVVTAVLSPFFAYLVGVGPQFLAIVPAVSVGNVVFVAILGWLSARAPGKRLASYGAVAAGAAAKCLCLWLLVAKVIAPAVVPAAKVPVISAMFSWPQLVTALIGGVLAVTIVPVVKKALSRP